MRTTLLNSIAIGLALALVPHSVLSADSVLLKGPLSGDPDKIPRVAPLDSLVVLAPYCAIVEVRDASGQVYVRMPSPGQVEFRVGGALGEHSVSVRDSGGRESRIRFLVEAETSIDDGGRYRSMFQLFRSSMNTYSPTGVSQLEWNNRTWQFFVNWGLDHNHTMKGMKYFSPVGAQFVDLMRAVQREDGMIWSFILDDDNSAYYQTCYGPFGYVRQYGDRYFVRQPSENHPEYIYVSTIYQCWKASGDDAWMQQTLASAARALDYGVTDPARWSQRFQLLKRVYTIDSWDFQVEDAYTPKLGLTDTMLIHPEKSKFGIFFGDNVYYAAACDELAEMAAHVGDAGMAGRFRDRAVAIRTRLDALSWNGRFFTHFIDEDPTVHRDLGVDEKSQFAQGNAYALNRGIRSDQAEAIIQGYLDLKNHPPPGSPGEWYAIYPPFGKGFDRHGAKWQYMNGGVGGHVAGELARGAFAHGHEAYGLDILERLADLGYKHDGKIRFAYTGSIPPPPPAPNYTEVGLAGLANMDLTDQGGPASAPWMRSNKPGDDLRGLPTGTPVLAGIPFNVTDPEKNERRSVVAVSRQPGLPATVDVPVNRSAGSVYLLHTSSKPTSEKVCGSVTFVYDDGTTRTQYLIMEKHLTYWWFSKLKNERSGIAWEGPSPVAAQVGLSWCAVDNPEPGKLIRSLRFDAPQDNGIYALAGLTLADRPHYVAPSPVSYGGPDNWAGATAMAALIEGLAGVTDAPLSECLSQPVLSPRWSLTSAETVKAVVRYAAAQGYVAYTYTHRPAEREIRLTVTGSGRRMDAHILLPVAPAPDLSVRADGLPLPHRTSDKGASHYVDFTLATIGPQNVVIRY